MRASDQQLVHDLDLFAGMAASGFDELMRASFLQRFPARVVLVREGDPCDFLHVVVEGLVELYATSSDRESAVSLAEPVSTFILAAAVKDSAYLMSARTLVDSRILMIPSVSVRDVFARDNVFARAVVRELATGYRGLVRTLKDQKLRTGTERLANYLLRLHRKQGEPDRLELPVEKRTLASLLTMTPENLSRAFAALEGHGVAVDGPRVLLRDIAALRSIAKPHPLIDLPEA